MLLFLLLCVIPLASVRLHLNCMKEVFVQTLSLSLAYCEMVKFYWEFIVSPVRPSVFSFRSL